MIKLTMLSILITLNSFLLIYGCTYDVLESIPEGVSFDEPVSKSTYNGLIKLIDQAEYSIDIASFYWSLLCKDVLNTTIDSCQDGESLLNKLAKVTRDRNIKTRIAVNKDSPSATDINKDLEMLQDAGALIRFVDFNKLVGAGVLHTKFLIIDGKTFYVGSANMDWRSLTQVKELGISINNCEVLAKDLEKIFEVYWYLGQDNSTIPVNWPEDLSTNINAANPVTLHLNDVDSQVYFSSSPKSFNPAGRTNDVDSILDIINSAEEFIYIAVMDYSPSFLYGSTKYWPVIDDALRRAAFERKVKVKLLASDWLYTRKDEIAFLRSLDSFYDFSYKHAGRIDVKMFKVPDYSRGPKIPFSRVNHNKYMVTDKSGYIGTSNWSADYFVNTGGVGLSVSSSKSNYPNRLEDKLERIFLRDWNSEYSNYLNTRLN